MSLHLQPIYLLADSQLMFRKEGTACSIFDSVRDTIETAFPSAAYIGASNGDDPISYSIFQSALEAIGLHRHRMIPSTLSAYDEDFVNNADIILLAGGDVERGLRVFADNGLKEIVTRRYLEGALLIGVSAGSVQMGLSELTGSMASSDKVLNYFEFVNCIIGVHEEADGWGRLRQNVKRHGGQVRGIGIPSGGGAIYHADNSLEPLRSPLSEFLADGDEVIRNLLLPGDDRKVQRHQAPKSY
jgi:cyanophycinase